MGNQRKRKPYRYDHTKDGKDNKVKAKKHLGQHFLTDEIIAERIANTLSFKGYETVLEIGPGTGVLTKYLLTKGVSLKVMELDKESVNYLNDDFKRHHEKTIANGAGFQIIEGDFLKYDMETLIRGPFAITGNFPYNISSQIVFKVLHLRHQIPEFSGMFQKEVAKRICEPSGTKTYGILSVLVQAFYSTEYLFTVHPQVFDPPPKVQSGVLRLVRKTNYHLPCDEKLFFTIVKMAFNQRRKTLRNSLKSLEIPTNIKEDLIFDKRPEQLGVPDFITLVQLISNDAI